MTAAYTMHYWISPIVYVHDKNKIFVRGLSHTLDILEPKNLKRQAKHSTNGKGFFACCIYNNIAYIGCYEGELFKYDMTTLELVDHIKFSHLAIN